jgi:hypothetical protein
VKIKARIVALFALVAVLGVGVAYEVRLKPHVAQASYRVTITDPEVTFDGAAFEKSIAQFCKTNGITTNAQYVSGVAGITAGSALELAAVKALLLSVTLVP